MSRPILMGCAALAGIAVLAFGRQELGKQYEEVRVQAAAEPAPIPTGSPILTDELKETLKERDFGAERDYGLKMRSHEDGFMADNFPQ